MKNTIEKSVKSPMESRAWVIYASFGEVSQALDAAGTLQENGVAPDRIEIASKHDRADTQRIHTRGSEEDLRFVAEMDAELAEEREAGIDFGTDEFAELNMYALPTYGMVGGRGPLSALLAAGVDNSSASARESALHQFLSKHGVSEEIISKIMDDFDRNGAILETFVPLGDTATLSSVERILSHCRGCRYFKPETPYV